MTEIEEITPAVEQEIERKEVGIVSQDDAGTAKREGTRSTIAQIYVIGFLIIIGIALVASFQKDFSVDDMSGILITISGILSGPLGFIIGYYYKASKE